MQFKIRINQFCFGLLLAATFLLSNVYCQTNCISCDSKNGDQPDCGQSQETKTDGVTNEACSGGLGCYSQIYPSESAPTVWYTKRGCLASGQVCTENTCRSCDSENCNIEVLTVDRHQCLKCQEGDCTQTTSAFCENYVEGSNICVTLFDDAALPVYRSCYDDLPDETKTLCDAKGYDCAMCTGKNCNYASTRFGTKCHKCSGIDCLIIDSLATLVDCESSCYVAVNSLGQPERGCFSEDLETSGACSGDETSTDSCFVCDGDGCNDIVHPSIGRLTCRTCVDGDCSENNDHFEYCAVYNDDEKCASVFNNDNEVMSRGCVSTLAADLQAECLSGSANCFQCSYDRCNKDDSMLKTDFCIACSSKEDPNCLSNNPNTEIRCSTNQCYTRLMEQKENDLGRFTERGCLADLDVCTSPDCLSCSGKNCNIEKFPENRVSCKSCEFASCKGFEVDVVCNAYSSFEACFTFFGDDGDVNFRGCYSDAPNGTRGFCDDPINLECSKCFGDLCNTAEKRSGNRCFKCEGAECFKVNQESLVDCASDCYVGMTALGFPKRDCASAVVSSSSCGNPDLNCHTCGQDLCNGITFPTQSRLTCLKCVDEGCENGNSVSEYCERVDSNERCVTIFDGTGAVAERGCSSSVQNAAICSANESNCHKCSFDECNVDSATNQIAHCILCDSKDDPNCVTNPQLSKTAACTTNQCFTSLMTIETEDAGQHIQRGCQTSISTCASGSCSSCAGERCNNGVYPSDRNTCYFCAGGQCLTNSLQEKRCLSYESTKNCITVFGVESEVIYRDCYADATRGTRNYCNGNNLDCEKCVGKNCNSVTVRKGAKCLKCNGIECQNASDRSNSIECATGGCYIGLNSLGETIRDCASSIENSSTCAKNETFSSSCLVCESDYCNNIIFPLQNRLICKDCVGYSCEDNKILEEKYCERISATERCVSVFDNNDKILERGCLSSLNYPASCSGTSSSCARCDFNSCNTHDSKNSVNFCVSCDSKEDRICVNNTTSPRTKTCDKNECFSRNVPSSSDPQWMYVVKGCASDLPATFNCTGTSCEKCSGDRCNNILYPSTRISCLNCRGNECKNPPIPPKVCDPYSSQRQACVTLFDSNGEVNYRGCYSEAKEETKTVCDDSSQLFCTKCSTNLCNTAEKRRGQKCFKCEGLGCFNPTFPGDVVDCLSNCYVGVNSRGETVRGCSSSFTNTTACGTIDNGSNRCQVCSDDYCNGLQFPVVNRLQCFTSYSPSDENLKYCSRYNNQERCVTLFDVSDNKVIERGCSSELINDEYCRLNYKNCITCAGSRCNNIASLSVRMCTVCDSATNPDCVLSPASLGTKNCEKGCYTRLVNETLHRGCFDDLGETFECSEKNKCKYCSASDKCNIEIHPTDRRSCRKCLNSLSCVNSTPQHCVNYKEFDSCVTIFNQYSVSMRGCLSDMTRTNQDLCSKSDPRCSSCTTSSNCNIETVRSDETCVICNSALEPRCSQDPAKLSNVRCSVPSNGQCFTRLIGGATERGCQGMIVGGCSGTNCSLTGSGMNNEIMPENRRKCYHCNSDIDSGCLKIKTASEVPSLPCIRFSLSETCIKIELNSTTIRGCSADFSTALCQDGKCTRCDEDNCNEASQMTFNSLCSILSIFCLLKYLSIK